MTSPWLIDPAQLWPDYRPTRLLELPALARRCGVARVYAKAENERPLGNFKSLGGMTAGLRALARVTGADSLDALQRHCRQSPAPMRLLCASDGNHGLAVAAAAQRVGAHATVYLPAAVDEPRAARIAALGGKVVRIDGSYDDAVLAASAMAARGDGVLIADTASDPGDAVVADVMHGYGLLTRELAGQWPDHAGGPPSHAFIQAGVGGLAAAMAEGLRTQLRASACIVVVEPDSAACVTRALQAGAPVAIDGDLDTAAGMLSCGLASAPALAVLLRHDARGIGVDEAMLDLAVTALREAGGPHSTASGAAGLAGLLRASADPELRAAHALGGDSRVLLVISEGDAALRD
ncbi:pyridoxal-phosphate dependent enzyme [Lysobacter sp. CA196]|uniref:pyridoxal-phosphate dependent enzyme n=1 Tax=Lysobacter sp. CA196 TaxID=3455606 RepID=UPI003F8D8883